LHNGHFQDKLGLMAGKIRGLRGVADAAFKEALLAADPEEAVYRHFRLRGDVLKVGDIDYFLSRFRRIFVIGAGKASVRMASAVERILGDQLTGGLVITGRGQTMRLRRVVVREAAHPLPDQDGVRATEELLELVGPLNDHDLVICLLSGGGSAMLTAPVDGVSVTDLQRANKAFLDSGMSIDEINTVRKALSRVKGGKLARAIHPATTITLLLSDVIGDRVSVIASGPTAPGDGGKGASGLLRKKEIWERMPDSVKAVLDSGNGGATEEEDIFAKVHHRIVGSNRLSLLAAEQKAHKLGMNSLYLTSTVSGESREIAHFYAALAREIRTNSRPVKTPACIIAGGETTVTIRGDGKGGRCQEMALSFACEARDIPGVVFLAAGTDGLDGPTDAAGAFADSETFERAVAMGLSPEEMLSKNDSYNFFSRLEDLVMTGPTGTNVMDVHILLVG